MNRSMHVQRVACFLLLGVALTFCRSRITGYGIKADGKEGGKDTGGGFVVEKESISLPSGDRLRTYEFFDLWYGSRKYDVKTVRSANDIREQVKAAVDRIVNMDYRRFRDLPKNVNIVMDTKQPFSDDISPANDYPKEFKPADGGILPLFAFTADGYILVNGLLWSRMNKTADDETGNRHVRTDIAAAYIHEALRHMLGVSPMETIAILAHTFSDLSKAEIKARYADKFLAKQVQNFNYFSLEESFVPKKDAADNSATMKACEAWLEQTQNFLAKYKGKVSIAAAGCDIGPEIPLTGLSIVHGSIILTVAKDFAIKAKQSDLKSRSSNLDLYFDELLATIVKQCAILNTKPKSTNILIGCGHIAIAFGGLNDGGSFLFSKATLLEFP